MRKFTTVMSVIILATVGIGILIDSTLLVLIGLGVLMLLGAIYVIAIFFVDITSISSPSHHIIRNHTKSKKTG